MIKNHVQVALGHARTFFAWPFNSNWAKWTKGRQQIGFGNVPWNASEEYFVGEGLVAVISRRQLASPSTGGVVKGWNKKLGVISKCFGGLQKIICIPAPVRCSLATFSKLMVDSKAILAIPLEIVVDGFGEKQFVKFSYPSSSTGGCWKVRKCYQVPEKHKEHITWRFWLARATAGSNSARLGPTVAWNFGGSMSAKTESSFEDDSVDTTLSGPAALTSSGSWGADSIFDVAGKLNGWNTFSAITGESTDPEDLDAFVRLSDLWNKSKGILFIEENAAKVTTYNKVAQDIHIDVVPSAKVLTSEAGSIANVWLWRMAPSEISIAAKVAGLLAKRRSIRGAVVHHEYFIVRRVVWACRQPSPDRSKVVQSSVSWAEVQPAGGTTNRRHPFEVGSSKYFAKRRRDIGILEFAALNRSKGLRKCCELAKEI